MNDWKHTFVLLVGLRDNEATDEEKLSAYQEARTNILSVPEIRKHVDISVSAKQVKASWKKGGQIAKFNRYENDHELTGFFSRKSRGSD